MKEGLIYGFETVGSFGGAPLYNFGRTRVQDVVQMQRQARAESNEDWANRQKDVLKKRMKRFGLNTPSRMLLWLRVPDLDAAWDELVEHLRGHGTFMSKAGTIPLVTLQMQLGDHWYTVENLSSEQFGKWIQTVMHLVRSM